MLGAVRSAVPSQCPRSGLLLRTRIDPDNPIFPESIGGGNICEGYERISLRRASIWWSLICGWGETEGLKQADCNCSPANRQQRPCRCLPLSVVA